MSDECSGLSVRSLPAGHFNMPYEMVREGMIVYCDVIMIYENVRVLGKVQIMMMS